MLNRIWQWVGRNDKQLKIAFALIAAGYVLYEYIDRGHEAKVSKSYDYVKRYNEGELGAARKSLSGFWSSKSLADWKKEINPTNFYVEIPKRVRQEGLVDEIALTGAFLAELGLCVEAGACDASTACHFFYDDLQAFRHNYKWYLEELDEWRNATPLILGNLASGSCGKQNRAYCKANSTSPYCPKSA
jgi:hypothetical protein